LMFTSQIIHYTELVEIYAMSAISDFAEGAASGMLIFGVVETSRYGQKIKAFKQRLMKRKQ
ncbi:MAG: transcriptional regulator, partial [Lachnospiraceae bacterium]